MKIQLFYLSILTCLLVYSEIHLVACQGNSLTFSPSTPLCIGGEVVMTCFVVPPTSEQFGSTTAAISFDGIIAAGFANINDNTVPGVNTSRYTADIAGLTISISRPGARLTISNFQASDAATNFSCHGEYSGDIPSYALISDYPPLADAVNLSNSILTVRPNISQDTSIYLSLQLNLTNVDRPDTLLYTFFLHIQGNVVNELVDLTATEATSTPFNNTKFIIDNYYHISITAENCVGGCGSIDSKTFVLLGLQQDNGNFRISSSNLSRIEWIYSNLDTSYGEFEQDYLSEDLFTFTIDDESITEFSLYLPHRFDFALPPGYDQSVRDGMLNISFNGILLGEVVEVKVRAMPDITLTAILGVLGGLLFILLIVIVCITALFVVIHIRKRKSP